MHAVLLLGMGPTALSALDSLSELFRVVGVVRDAVDPGDAVVARAQVLGVPVSTEVGPATISALVERLRPDCTVISSYNRILGPALLSRGRFVNVHYAPLPRYRGRATLNWAIINGEREAAISIHTVAPGLDAGNILFQRPVPISPHATVGELYAELNELQRAHLGASVARFLAGYAGEPQDEAEATYGCTRVPADGEIDWTASTAVIYRLIRALSEPYPGAFTFLNGRRITIWRARPVVGPANYVGRVPGRVVSRDKQSGLVNVLTGDGVLQLLELQREGAPRAAAAELISSTAQTLGLRSADLLARVAVLEAELARLRAQDALQSDLGP